MATRDATLWYYETPVETCQDLLGVLAGINRLYFSKFQFKRMHAFVGQMAVAPVNVADRVDRLFTAPPNVAVVDIERLVSETVTLVETHMLEIDTTPIRSELGKRDQPWSLPSGWLG